MTAKGEGGEGANLKNKQKLRILPLESLMELAESNGQRLKKVVYGDGRANWARSGGLATQGWRRNGNTEGE